MPLQLSDSIPNPNGKKEKHQQSASGAKVMQTARRESITALLPCYMMSKCITCNVQPELLGLCRYGHDHFSPHVDLFYLKCRCCMRCT